MIIVVHVKPSSKKGAQVKLEVDGSLLVYVHEPAQKGKANQATLKALSRFYKVSKSSIRLISGETSKQKRFLIDSQKLTKEIL
jgi:uncharacterized protein (TIGR00251 family)